MAGEDSAVGADTQRKGENHGGGECGRFANEAEGGFEIGDSGVEESDAVDVADFFLDFFLTAKIREWRAGALRRGAFPRRCSRRSVRRCGNEARSSFCASEARLGSKDFHQDMDHSY